MTTTFDVKLPDLFEILKPLKATKNPNLESVKTDALKWIEKYSIACAKKVHLHKLHSYVSYCYVNANAEKLRIVIDALNLYTLMDDICEDNGKLAVEILKEMEEIFSGKNGDLSTFGSALNW